MADLISNLAVGFSVAVSLQNILYCLIGVTVSTLIGILPGLGPTATIAMLLPLTYGMPASAALIMLAGIYYGAQYGGSTTAILVNLPGESSSVITCIDGYAMARQGRAGTALAIVAIGSFIGGTVATVFVALLAEPLSRLALKFGPQDYFGLIVFGLCGAVVLARGSVLNATAMVVLGAALGMIGIDAASGTDRFTFGFVELFDGISFVTLAVGLFGISEILLNLEEKTERSFPELDKRSWNLSRTDVLQSFPAIARGTVIGSLLGIMPGGGANLSSFGSYAVEKKLSAHPEQFGKGAIEGVAGPETANNAAAQTAFIPLLTLGVPSNAVMAVLVGAMMIQGIAPGPQFMTARPELFWGLVASMWVGNAMLLVLNLPMIGIWVKLLRIPYRLLYPTILLLVAIGSYSVALSATDVVLCGIFGVAGYLMIKFGLEPAPLVLGFVLSRQLEQNFNLSMIIGNGDPTVFVRSGISLSFLIAACVLMTFVMVPKLNRKRSEVM